MRQDHPTPLQTRLLPSGQGQIEGRQEGGQEDVNLGPGQDLSHAPPPAHAEGHDVLVGTGKCPGLGVQEAVSSELVRIREVLGVEVDAMMPMEDLSPSWNKVAFQYGVTMSKVGDVDE